MASRRKVIDKLINTHSASQEIPHFLWNQKVHNCVYKNLPPDPILSYMTAVHILQSISLRSILILSSHVCLVLPNDLFPADN
jgi:hypothetical protein